MTTATDHATDRAVFLAKVRELAEVDAPDCDCDAGLGDPGCLNARRNAWIGKRWEAHEAAMRGPAEAAGMHLGEVASAYRGHVHEALAEIDARRSFALAEIDARELVDAWRRLELARVHHARIASSLQERLEAAEWGGAPELPLVVSGVGGLHVITWAPGERCRPEDLFLIQPCHQVPPASGPPA
jgi:hypothetical protein